MKYIPAEKLLSEIERRKRFYERTQERLHQDDPEFSTSYAIASALKELRSFITSLQQEQPEVDLEKFTEKIKTFQGRYKHPEIVSIKGAMAFMARMFYQYPNIARQWYDGLSKATMDDARKEE